jgi:hypothetical protein
LGFGICLGFGFWNLEFDEAFFIRSTKNPFCLGPPYPWHPLFEILLLSLPFLAGTDD